MSQELPSSFKIKAVKAAETGRLRAMEVSVAHESLSVERSQLDNQIVSQGPHLVLEQFNEN